MTESIIRKIQNLLKRTTENGASVEEMDTALKIAQRLMDKYSLSFEDVKEEDIEVGESEFIEIITKNSFQYLLMAKSIAELFHCDIVSVREVRRRPFRGRRGLKIIGEPEHRRFVEFLLTEIFLNSTQLFRNISKQEGYDRHNVLREKYSFERGYFDAVRDKADKLIKERKELSSKQGSTGTSLMVIDSVVKQYMTRYKVRSLGSTSRTYSANSYNKGYSEGSNQSLDKRVNKGNLLLK